MRIITKKIADMDRAKYNPRMDLRPGEDEYENLHSNIIRFGMILPVVWNERTNTVVGGHQRLTVLEKVENVKKLPMPRLAMKYGAEIIIGARSGRHNVLHAATKPLAEKKRGFIVQYGINLTAHGDVLLDAVSAQAENLPDEIENLVMTCGSGITASGVMIGLHRYGKKVKHVHLVATAPDRRAFIHDNLQKYGADRDFHYHSLFHTPGFVYEKGAKAVWGGITLHPHYEAKTMQWFMQSGLNPSDTLFWIVGAEPKISS